MCIRDRGTSVAFLYTNTLQRAGGIGSTSFKGRC
jgi:hypothetical protein